MRPAPPSGAQLLTFWSLLALVVLALTLLVGCSTWQPPEQRAMAVAVGCHALDLMQTDAALETGRYLTLPCFIALGINYSEGARP